MELHLIYILHLKELQVHQHKEQLIIIQFTNMLLTEDIVRDGIALMREIQGKSILMIVIGLLHPQKVKTMQRIITKKGIELKKPTEQEMLKGESSVENLYPIAS